MADNTKKHAIFSIKPKYVQLILSGEKTVELRRTLPRFIEKGSRVYIWESSPKRRFAGVVNVVAVESIPINRLWATVSHTAGISESEFEEYFAGAKEGVAVFLCQPEEFAAKPELSTLRENFQFRPPQSFRYVSESEVELLCNS